MGTSMIRNVVTFIWRLEEKSRLYPALIWSTRCFPHVYIYKTKMISYLNKIVIFVLYSPARFIEIIVLDPKYQPFLVALRRAESTQRTGGVRT